MASEPTQYCSACGIGPFFTVDARPRPDLCLDCSEGVTATRYRVDCSSDARGWASNALRFDSVESATEYAHDLASRWMALKLARVVSADTAERETVDATDTRIVVDYR